MPQKRKKKTRYVTTYLGRKAAIAAYDGDGPVPELPTRFFVSSTSKGAAFRVQMPDDLNAVYHECDQYALERCRTTSYKLVDKKAGRVYNVLVRVAFNRETGEAKITKSARDNGLAPLA